MQITDIAWAAGFIDGEGTITLRGHSADKKAGHPSPYFSTELYGTNTNEESLLKLQSLFGGSVRPYTKLAPWHKQVYRWRIFGQRAINVIGLLLPYLIVKREQANLVITYQTRPKYNLHGKVSRLSNDELVYRESMVKQIRLLNKRGI